MAHKTNKERGILEWPPQSGKWWVRLYVNGRERRYRCDSKSQAKALYMKLKTEIRENRYFEKKHQNKEITLRAWIKRYLEGSSNLGFANEQRYGRFWSLLLGNRIITEISTEECRRIQAKMKAKGRLKPATINRYFSFLRHILILAVKDRKIDRNPVSQIRFYPEVKKNRFLREEEIFNLKKKVTPSNWKFIVFALETGLRRGEQFKLRWDQVDLENGIVTIPLPKGQKTRHVPLSDTAKAILRSFDSFLYSPWVFPSPKDFSKPRNAQAFVNDIFTPALKEANIQGVCWHTLRHTLASRLVMAGVDLFTVKEILGHRDIQTTMRYAHLSPQHLKDAINRGSLPPTVTKTVSGTTLGFLGEFKETTEDVGINVTLVLKKFRYI